MLLEWKCNMCENHIATQLSPASKMLPLKPQPFPPYISSWSCDYSSVVELLVSYLLKELCCLLLHSDWELFKTEQPLGCQSNMYLVPYVLLGLVHMGTHAAVIFMLSRNTACWVTVWWWWWISKWIFACCIKFVRVQNILSDDNYGLCMIKGTALIQSGIFC